MNQGPINGAGEVVLYKTPNGEVQLDVRLERETVWLTQLQMATLFGTTPENVLMHLKNVYAEKELGERSTTKDFLAVRTEGKRQVRRKLEYDNRAGESSKNLFLKWGEKLAVWQSSRSKAFLWV